MCTTPPIDKIQKTKPLFTLYSRLTPDMNEKIEKL